MGRRLNWDKARKRLVATEHLTRLDRRADAILARGAAEPPEARAAARVLHKTRKRVKRADAVPLGQASKDIWIVVGGDHTRSGQREVHNFRTLREAHVAGFTWAI